MRGVSARVASYIEQWRSRGRLTAYSHALEQRQWKVAPEMAAVSRRLIPVERPFVGAAGESRQPAEYRIHVHHS